MKLQIKTMAIVLIGFLAFCATAQAQSDVGAKQVQAVLEQYFVAFDKTDLAAMEALSSPNIEVVDYGESFNFKEWSWYMNFNFKDMGISGYHSHLSNFNTRMFGEIAYTTFQMRGEGGPVELAAAVLKHVNGKWLIDLLTIERGQTWHQWLRDRIRSGQKVPANWYQEYLQQETKAK